MAANHSVVELARQFKAQLDSMDVDALERLSRAYYSIWERLAGRVDALLLEIDQAGLSSGGQIARLARYRSLQSQAEAQAGDRLD